MKSMQREIEAVRRVVDMQEELIVERYRNKYIVPYCDRHKLRLRSGMGTWVLVNQKGEHVGAEWGPTKPLAKHIRSILDCELVCGMSAGSVMREYTPRGM